MIRKGEVRFGRGVAYLGVLAGVAIAVGIPCVVLACNGSLAGGDRTAIIIVALLVGGTTATVSAFFGVVMPKTVGEKTLGSPADKGKGKPSGPEGPAPGPQAAEASTPEAQAEAPSEGP